MIHEEYYEEEYYEESTPIGLSSGFYRGFIGVSPSGTKIKKTIMTEIEFGKAVEDNIQSIKNVLYSKNIYDDDLFNDTYIALFEESQKNEIEDFTNAYVEFYGNLLKRREEHESHFECHDNTEMLDFDRPDETDLEYREKVGQRVDKLIRYYAEHPQPRERNHRRACKVLRLYRQGYNECEISHKLKISQQAVSQHLARAVSRLKLVAK